MLYIKGDNGTANPITPNCCNIGSTPTARIITPTSRAIFPIGSSNSINASIIKYNPAAANIQNSSVLISPDKNPGSPNAITPNCCSNGISPNARSIIPMKKLGMLFGASHIV